MLYDKSEQILRDLYKTASFVVQAICFLQSGRYFRCMKDVADIACPEERSIIRTFLDLKNGGEVAFEEMSEALFCWTKGWIGQCVR
jgi:hypothetical protein